MGWCLVFFTGITIFCSHFLVLSLHFLEANTTWWFIPPLHRGCDLCASLVRSQNWPGRRWRQKGGRTVALVVQGWHIGRSGIAMDAMVAVKFWACSKQSHKGRRGGRSLTGRSNEAGRRHTHRRSRRMDAQWSAIGRPVKNVNIVYQFERHVCLPCTTIVPPLADQWRPLGDHCGDHCASIQRPRQHLSHHGNGSAFTLPSLCDLLCHYSSFGRFKEGTRVVLQQLHRNRTFWVPATTERPNHFYGRTKVAWRSQPCVKGALLCGTKLYKTMLLVTFFPSMCFFRRRTWLSHITPPCISSSSSLMSMSNTLFNCPG